MKKISFTFLMLLLSFYFTKSIACAAVFTPMKNGLTYIFGDRGEAYWMFTKVLEKADSNEDIVTALSKNGTVYASQTDEEGNRLIIGQLSGFNGVLVSTEGLVIGGKLEKVKSDKIDAYYNRNCYIAFNNGLFNETGTDLITDGNIINYKNHAVWNKQGETVGKIMGTGIVYDNELKEIIGSVSPCIKVRVLKNNDPQKIRQFINILTK